MKVKALRMVVSITVLEVRVPSCPMLRAMLKQLTVVGEASMMSMPFFATRSDSSPSALRGSASKPSMVTVSK